MVRRHGGNLCIPGNEEVCVLGPLCLIVNPAAGNGRARELLPPARSALTAAGAEIRIVESSSLAHARELAAAAAGRGEVVVAVGGDGTAGALAGVAATSGARYGLIPAGRGNDLAGVLGIPSDPAAAVRVLTTGQVRQIDLIAVSTAGQPETVVAGSVYAGIPAVAGEFDGYAVVVANSARFGAGMQVAPPAAIDDGVLDVVLMRHAAKVTFVRALMKIKDGSHVALPQISLRRGADVTITVSRDLPAAADGEPLSCAMPLAAGTPLRIRALPAALSVLVPAG